VFMRWIVLTVLIRGTINPTILTQRGLDKSLLFCYNIVAPDGETGESEGIG